MWGGVAFRGSGGASIVGVNSFVRYFSRKRAPTWPSRFGGGSGSNSSLIQGRINSTERNPTWPSWFGGGSGSNSSLIQGRINSTERNPTWPSRFGGGSGSNSSLIQGRINSTERNPTWPSRFGGGGGGGGDMIMAVNLLGIEGSRSGNLHQQQQQQMLDLEAMTHQRLPIISPFQHQLSHGLDQSISHGLDQSGMENNIWDV